MGVTGGDSICEILNWDKILHEFEVFKHLKEQV